MPSGTTVAGCGASALSGLQALCPVCSFVGLISAAPSGTTVAGCGASALSGLQALCLVCSFVGLISAAPSGTTVAGCGASALSGLQALCVFCSFVGADKRSAIRHNGCRMRRKRLIRPTSFIPDL
ncbi:hypothetical protein D3H39_03270 [Citrobacter portucalensis]|nr:hypothetical protein D3H39_03270 [Citrobacter portucalensis]